jgi:hypothetical protein
LIRAECSPEAGLKNAEFIVLEERKKQRKSSAQNFPCLPPPPHENFMTFSSLKVLLRKKSFPEQRIEK